jgi:hypothetical protein
LVCENVFGSDECYNVRHLEAHSFQFSGKTKKKIKYAIKLDVKKRRLQSKNRIFSAT